MLGTIMTGVLRQPVAVLLIVLSPCLRQSISILAEASWLTFVTG
jgi:hypothetical protein